MVNITGIYRYTYKKAIKWVIDDEDAILQIDSNSKEVKEGKMLLIGYIYAKICNENVIKIT